jgi:mRNA-degrading endonuclease toxin of MazEF toxin-antitoxin module
METASGLAKPCVACCLNVMTFEQLRVLRRIGYLSPAAMQRIEDCMKTVLEIP